VPDTIRLLPNPSRGGFLPDASYQLLPVVERYRGGRSYAWWTSNRDSIRLTWTTGLAGVTVQASSLGDRMTGTVVQFWDVADGIPNPVAQFEARRFSCSVYQ
jgi:hypothetical protein